MSNLEAFWLLPVLEGLCARKKSDPVMGRALPGANSCLSYGENCEFCMTCLKLCIVV